MATRNRSTGRNSRGNGNSRRNGSRNGTRNGSARRNNSTLLWLEIFGAGVLAIVLIFVFSGAKGERIPRTTPPKKVAKAERPKPSTPAYKPRTPKPKPKPRYDPNNLNLDGEPGIPPKRPAPRVDVEKGDKLFQEAQKLWNKQLDYRQKGDNGKARETLWKAYNLLEEAADMAERFDDWVADADMGGWAVNSATRKVKRSVDRWYKLRSHIHKVLPKTDKK